MHTDVLDDRCPKCGWMIEVYIPHECKRRDKTEQEVADDERFRTELLQGREEGS